MAILVVGGGYLYTRGEALSYTVHSNKMTHIVHMNGIFIIHYFGEWIAGVLQPPETIHYFRCTAGMSLAEQGSATCRKY